MTEIELTPIDRHFADFILRTETTPVPLLWDVAAITSHAAGNGHVCRDLSEIAGDDIAIDGNVRVIPPLEEVMRTLYRSRSAGMPGDYRPLILDRSGRIYLYRMWKYEKELARVILEKAEGRPDFDRELLASGLRRLFPGAGGTDEIDRQKLAAITAVTKSFCVISGGPGTGKTSSVVKIIALLLEQAGSKKMAVGLAAPTGKAAARLAESIRLMKENLDCDEDIKARIPDEVHTIHRLLGPLAGSRFRHTADDPVPFDVVVVDEASMVPLPLMSKLAVALRKDAKLLLLGDHNQLASVEAGAVLGDVCGGGGSVHPSPDSAALYERLTEEKPNSAHTRSGSSPLADAIVVLEKNYRFRPGSGIGEAGRAVNAGRGADAIGILKREGVEEVAWRDLPTPDGFPASLKDRAVEGYAAFLKAETAADALSLFDSFRILCAVRKGPFGVEKINSLVEKSLAEKGLIDLRSRWYPGRPVMITVNDYRLGLFNGDVGIVLTDERTGDPAVYFPAGGGEIRRLSPGRLPAHETVYAMTVHKSQGSEFDSVLIILPQQDSRVLTRELVYTAMTRARKKVEMWGAEQVFQAAAARKVERTSGLRDILWPTGTGKSGTERPAQPAREPEVQLSLF
jgi:exodeoxyribonuclease V alpha subunit